MRRTVLPSAVAIALIGTAIAITRPPQSVRPPLDSMSAQRDPRMLRPKRHEVDDHKDDIKGLRTATVGPKLKKAIDTAGMAKQVNTGGQDAPQCVIDVMVAYTAKAAANYRDIVRELIERSIAETNLSFRASKIDDVAVRLVNTHLTDYDEAGAEHFDHVWRMVDQGDGFMEEIPKLRGAWKADIVILVVEDPQGCGLATRVAADAEEAYAVVHHQCAAISYSIPHEIGHIIGARHDHAVDKTPGFGHGFIDRDRKWRTMMSYKAGCNGCPRIPIWSTPAKVLNARILGDEFHDNARVIREQCRRVANFR